MSAVHKELMDGAARSVLGAALGSSPQLQLSRGALHPLLGKMEIGFSTGGEDPAGVALLSDTSGIMGLTQPGN